MNKARVYLALAALLLSACAGNAGNQEAGAPPIRNVLVLMSDDHAAYATGAYGNPIIRTPSIDRLAGEGVLFSRAYANSPVCSPSRHSIITGRLPHAAGVTLLRSSLSEDQLTIAEHLQSLGFKTGAVGKMAFYGDAKHGFDYRIEGRDHDRYLEAHPAQRPPGRYSHQGSLETLPRSRCHLAELARVAGYRVSGTWQLRASRSLR